MNRIIENPTFTPFAPKYLNIDDLVIVFFDGQKWKVISLVDVYQYQVIYDKYTDTHNSDRKQ